MGVRLKSITDHQIRKTTLKIVFQSKKKNHIIIKTNRNVYFRRIYKIYNHISKWTFLLIYYSTYTVYNAVYNYMYKMRIIYDI